MKSKLLLLAALLTLAPLAIPAGAQSHHHKKHHKHYVKHPKNEITKLDTARHEDHTVRQVTPDPKKSPGKHADNLSKNVNHEINRESKDINHFFQGKKK